MNLKYLVLYFLYASFIYSMEYSEPPQKKHKGPELESIKQEPLLDNVYITFQTSDNKKFVIRKNLVPSHFISALDMKEGKLENPVIPLTDIDSTVMNLVVDLFEAESTFKALRYDPFEQYDKMYILLQKQKKYSSFKTFDLQTWFALLNQLEYLGCSASTVDAFVRLCAKYHAKTLLPLRKQEFDNLQISDAVKKTLGKWFHRYAFKQGLLPNAAVEDAENPYLLDAVAAQYPVDDYLSFAAFLVRGTWDEFEDYSRGKRFYYDITAEPDDKKVVIQATTLTFDSVVFDYNIKKFCNKLLVDEQDLASVDIQNSTMLAQKGFHFFKFINKITLYKVNFPHGIHPHIFKNMRLEEVEISYTNLTNLPKELFSSSSFSGELTIVDLSHNQLTHLRPKLFKLNTDLKKLHLHNNPWTEQKDWESLPPHARRAAANTGFLPSTD